MNKLTLFLFLFLQICLIKAQDPFENTTENLLAKFIIQVSDRSIVATQTFDTILHGQTPILYFSGIKLFEIRNNQIIKSHQIKPNLDTIICPIGIIKEEKGLGLFSTVEVIYQDILFRYDLIDSISLEIISTKYFKTDFFPGTRINPNRKGQIVKRGNSYYGLFTLSTNEFPLPFNLNNDFPFVFKINEHEGLVILKQVGEEKYEAQVLLVDKTMKIFVTGDEQRILLLDTSLNILKVDTGLYYTLDFRTTTYYGKVSAFMDDSNIYSIGIVDSLLSIFLPFRFKQRIAIKKFDLNLVQKDIFTFHIPELENNKEVQYRPGFYKGIFKNKGKTNILFDYYVGGAIEAQNAIFLKVLDDSMNTIKTFKYEKQGKVLRAISVSFNQNKVLILLAEYNIKGYLSPVKPSLITIDLDSITSISEYLKEESNFNYYPNPSTGVVYFSTYNDLPIHKIELSNIYGQHIIREVIDNKVDLSDLADGLYMGKIEGNNFHKTCKIIISK